MRPWPTFRLTFMSLKIFSPGGHFRISVCGYLLLALEDGKNLRVRESSIVLVVDLREVRRPLFECFRRRPAAFGVFSVTHGAVLLEEALAVQ
jgi:hypothetical protein